MYFPQDNVADSTYEEQLRQQKEKTKNMREREMNDRMGPNMGGGASNNGGLLGSLGNLGGLGGLGMISNQANGLMQMLTTKGGDPINATVFISNVSERHLNVSIQLLCSLCSNINLSK